MVGRLNPNWIVPTAPRGTADNRGASTAFSANASNLTNGTVATSLLPFPYATGTWTPTDGSGAGLGFSAISVGYTRVGNIVNAYGRVTYTTTANGANAQINGLPVLAANAAYSENPNSVLVTGAALGPITAITLTNTTSFLIANGTSGASITNAQLSAAVVVFNITYPAA